MIGLFDNLVLIVINETKFLKKHLFLTVYITWNCIPNPGAVFIICTYNLPCTYTRLTRICTIVQYVYNIQ